MASIEKIKVSDLNFDLIDLVQANTIASDGMYYQMNSCPRGVCFVIANINYTNKDDDKLHGYEEDIKNLEEIFKKLYFAVVVVRDLKADQMLSAMERLADNDVLLYCDCLVVVTLAHGGIEVKKTIVGDSFEEINEYFGCAYGIDYDDENNRYEPLDVNLITQTFKTANCEHLRGKPRIIVNQFCKGDKDMVEFKLKKDNPSFDRQVEDFFYLNSTIDDHVSWVDGGSGSIFITALCNALRDHSQDKHLMTITAYIDAEMRQFSKREIIGGSSVRCMQTPMFTNKGCRLLNFNPRHFVETDPQKKLNDFKRCLNELKQDLTDILE